MAAALNCHASQTWYLLALPALWPQYNDICWKNAPDSVDKLETVFPVIDMVFGGGAVLKLKPLQYLFVLGGGSYCLGIFDNGNAGTLLGGITVRNVLLQVGLLVLHALLLGPALLWLALLAAASASWAHARRSGRCLVRAPSAFLLLARNACLISHHPTVLGSSSNTN